MFRSEQQQILELHEYIDKKFKADYISLQLDYLQQLKQLSLELKDPQIKLQPHGQDRHLHKRLTELNTWIDEHVRKQSANAQCLETKAKYLGGIVFPFK